MSKKSRRKVKRKTKSEILKERLILVCLIVSALAAFIFGSYMLLERFPGPNVLSPNDERLMRGDSQLFGNHQASVTIVEFIDLSCEACAKYNSLLEAITEKYDGKVNIVVRHFPRNEISITAAKAVESAALQGQYREMENLLLMRQKEWTSDPTRARSYLLDRAKELGLVTSKFSEGLDSPTIAERIRRDGNDAAELNLKTSPTFFVDGQRLLHPKGKDFVQVIDRKLKHNNSIK